MRVIILVAILCLAAASRPPPTTRRTPTTTRRTTTTTRRPPTTTRRPIHPPNITDFLYCYRKVKVNGNAELQIPHHNPYVAPFSYNITKQLGPYIHEQWSLVNQKWYGLANFTFHVVQIRPWVFSFTFKWPKLVVNGNWKRFANFGGFPHRDNGKFGMEIINRVWKGLIEVHPYHPKKLKITVRSSVDNVKFTVTDMPKEKVATEAYYSNYFRLLYNCDIYSNFLGKHLSDKYTNDWYLRPDKVKRLKEICHRRP